jgi:signal recognition particle subunit SRP54
MFDNLSERLERSFKILKGEGKITEINVAETLKDVRHALLDADVNYKVAKNFTDTVKEKALGQNVLTAVKPSQLMVKIVHDELTTLMGGDTAEIELKGRPAVILMSGLQGSGKTTFSGKLARMMKSKKNRKPLLVACDVYRPAAIEQLKVLGQQVEVPVYSELDSKDPVQIALNAIQEAKAKGYDLVIVDTAGRLAIDEQMMNEIEAIKKAINPDATLFVVDAMTGQDAVNTAREFNERLDFTGVVLTKLDGDTRGGAALSIRTVVNKPIMFVGTGEKLDAVDQFHPARMADRILGMGDIVSLVERAQEQYDEEEAKRLQKKIQKNQFDFNDFLTQIHQIKKMGNLKELASMIPGVGKAIKDIDIDDNAFKSIEAIIYSMTPEERTHPEILNGTRRTRIAKGSGTSIQEVNRIGHSRGIDGTAVHIHRNHRRGQLNVLVIHFTFSIKMCIALFRKDNRIACLINDRRIQRFFFLCGICGQRVHSQRIQRQRVPMKGIGLLSSPHTFSSHTLCFGIE